MYPPRSDAPGQQSPLSRYIIQQVNSQHFLSMKTLQMTTY